MAKIIHVIAGAMCVDLSDFLEMEPLGLVLASSTGSLIRNKADSHRVSPEPGALPRKPRAEWEPGARLWLRALLYAVLLRVGSTLISSTILLSSLIFDYHRLN